MTNQIPPRTEPLVDDDKFITLSWQSFQEALASGDPGTAWNPNFVGLTVVGTPNITGKYYRISDSLAYYRITVSASTSTSATNGTTYCDNFPLRIISDAANLSTSGFTAAPAGVTASDKRIYTATWSAVSSPIIITGMVEVN